MAPPSWAYQVDNFDPPADEELVCSICHGVFREPGKLPCNHVFCRGCVHHWLEKARKCPICRKYSTLSSIKNVVPLINNMIMKLTMRCRNWDKNCREKFTLEACETHMKNCLYELIQCKNKPCMKFFFRKDIGDHELQSCPHRTVKCSKCHLKIPPSDQGHDCIAALKRKLKAQDEDLKEKNKKIKELQKELKRLEEAQQSPSSDCSSLGSYSSTSSYSTAGIDDSSFSDFLDSRIDSAVDALFGNNEDSTNFQFIIQPCSLEASTSQPLNEEPVVRRPVKRRHPIQVLDISDEDDGNDQDSGPPLLPSPKRSWSMFQRKTETSNGASHSRNEAKSDGTAAGSSHASFFETSRNKPEHSSASGSKPQLPCATTTGLFSGSRATSSSASTSNVTEELKTSKGNGAASASTSAPRNNATHRNKKRNQRNGIVSAPQLLPNPTFERTLAMLRQYNLESDDEWRPTRGQGLSDDSSDSDVEGENVYLGDSIVTSHDSSHSDTEDSTSSLDISNSPEWFVRLCDRSGSNDPDWSPQ